MAAPYEEHDKASEVDTSVFREEFKYYRLSNSPLDSPDILDTDTLSKSTSDKVSVFYLHSPRCKPVVGLKPLSEWRAHSFPDFPGFIVIQNPFEKGWQSYWVKRCLKFYPNKPNITNLHAHRDMSDIDSIWESSQMAPGGSELSKHSLMMKLRWATLGYHYDWTNKKYYRDQFTAIADDLTDLSVYLGAVVGYPDFCPQAAIVNYYHLDSRLGPHTDHSEFDLAAPLISFSFGQDAVFLLGGITKDTKPMAVFLHSGDICVMTGDSRLAYHSVPKICPTDREVFHTEFSNREEFHTDRYSTQVQHAPQTVKDEDFELYRKYMSKSRININVRQVLKPGQNFPLAGEYCDEDLKY